MNTPVTKTKNNTEPVKFEILEGEAMYAFLHQPDKGNAKHRIGPAYKVDLVLNKEQLAKAKSLGLKIREPKGPDDKFKGPYVQIKSKVQEGRKPPRVVDSQRNPIPPSILVGNGSKVRVRFLPYFFGEDGVTPILQELQVLTLVPYEPTDRREGAQRSVLRKSRGWFHSTTGLASA